MDDRDARIAGLEAENKRLKDALLRADCCLHGLSAGMATLGKQLGEARAGQERKGAGDG